MDQHVGLLIVHGIGEQKRFETARQVGRSILAGLQARDDGAHFSLIDRASNPDGMPISCPRIDRQGSPFMIACRARGSADSTYVHLHEVWWSDLGAPATVGEQFRFWLWGLGQWGAKVIWKTHYPTAPGAGTGTVEPVVSNTDLLMVPPTKFKDVGTDDRAAKPRPKTRTLLFLTGLYALLTLFSWEAVKRAFAWVSPFAGSPAILTSYVGDVRIYTQAPGKGGGNITDIGQPWRATIRRRMISQMVAMAERDYGRWYVLGHSLGSIVAFNGMQEPDWNLPNYLDPVHVERLKSGPLKDTLWITDPPAPGEPQPDLTRMMPRRPVWLGAHDRISRKALFQNFRGLVTYGSPLDKFAALWPRIVPINRDGGAFPVDADWINLSDATDPVGADIDAFQGAWRTGTAPGNSPMNIRVKASPFFLLAHIRYFGMPSPGSRNRPETRALVELLFPASGSPAALGTAFASVGDSYGSPVARRALAVFWIVALGAALVAATSWLALILRGLGDATFALAPAWVERAWHGATALLQLLPVPGFLGTMITTLITACLVVFGAGIWRRRNEV